MIKRRRRSRENARGPRDEAKATQASTTIYTHSAFDGATRRRRLAGPTCFRLVIHRREIITGNLLSGCYRVIVAIFVLQTVHQKVYQVALTSNQLFD